MLRNNNSCVSDLSSKNVPYGLPFLHRMTDAVCMPRTSRSNRLGIHSNTSSYPFKTVIIVSCRFHFDCSRIGCPLVWNSYNIVPTLQRCVALKIVLSIITAALRAIAIYSRRFKVAGLSYSEVAPRK